MKQRSGRLYWALGGCLLAVITAMVFVLLTPANSTPVLASPLSQSLSDGQKLFEQKCTACHTIGQGNRVGPDLKGVTDIRTPSWLESWIQSPDKLLAEKDPIATELLTQFNNVPMPNLGLTKSDVDSIIAYLQSSSNTKVTPIPVQNLLTGNATSGKDLFTGVARFKNGGPPCMACHSVSGIGALGGGALGPDLTGVVNKLGGSQGLDAFLAGVPTSTMNSVWSKKPLTPQERANLIAFLQQASVEHRSMKAVGILAGLSVAGLIGLFAIVGFVWRRRLREVRRPMINHQTKRHS